MSMALDPTEIAKYRTQKVTSLNFKQRTCLTCKTRRSVGQYSKCEHICDRCVMRNPKAA